MPMPETVERAFMQDAGMGRALLAMLGAAIREKSLLWVALLGAVGLWVYTAIAPTPLRLIAAASYCVGVLWPMLYRKG